MTMTKYRLTRRGALGLIGGSALVAVPSGAERNARPLGQLQTGPWSGAVQRPPPGACDAPPRGLEAMGLDRWSPRSRCHRWGV